MEGVHVMPMSQDDADTLLRDTQPNEFDQMQLLMPQEQADGKASQPLSVIRSQASIPSSALLSPAEENKEKFVPRWLQAIEQSKREKEKKERQEKMARIARLQKLVEDTEEDANMMELLDKYAVERKMQDYLGKINTHLEVELQLLDAWRHPNEIKESNQE